jgi:2-C-methyl-D-erythritol 4-phosphate cytidylyltransferase/2-C-methyl-D-erythritol 2,4-cyclodiphosphate synthase
MHVTAIIAAGGRGRRLGADQPKQLLSIGGRPILERSVTAFLAHPLIDVVIVALPQALVDDPPAYLRAAEALGIAGSGKRLRIVAGGERRQDSVANAFRAVEAISDVIVIHDAARPFATADLIARTIAAAAESGAAVAAVPSRDTVKRVAPFPGAGSGPAKAGHYEREASEYAREAADHAREAPDHTRDAPDDGREAPDDGRGAEHGRDPSGHMQDPGHPAAVVSGFSRTVVETLPRDTIFLAQTPQAFRRDVLRDALAAGESGAATDEASLAERAGHPVRLVEGEATNIKITTPDDLMFAEAIAGRGEAMAHAGAFRVGTGYDLHRLVAGRALVLGGITVPADRGALGHSDADVVCHAVTDAILGAACLGDIGRHFPDTDARWKDASSIDLLTRAVALAADHGVAVENVDVTVILERPKIKDHVDDMRASLARALGIDVARVSIKGKTNEGVDAVGRGEAIAAHAVAMIREP